MTLSKEEKADREVRKLEKMTERKDAKGLERWLKRWEKDPDFFEKETKRDKEDLF
jgi:hypothetical protein